MPDAGDIGRLLKPLDDIVSRLDKISSLGDVFNVDSEGLDDVERKIAAITRASEKWGRAFSGVGHKMRSVKKEIAEAAKKEAEIEKKLKQRKGLIDSLAKQGKKQTDEYRAHVRAAKGLNDQLIKVVRHEAAMHDRLEDIEKTWDKIGRKQVGQTLVDSLERLAKGSIEVSIGALAKGFNFLERSIVEVYNVHERWTNLIGTFNTHVGTANDTTRGWIKEASKADNVLRSLTGEFGIGYKEVATYQNALDVGRESERGFASQAVITARAVLMETSSAAKLREMMMKLGMSFESTGELMKNDIIAGARAARVNVRQYSRAVSENVDLLGKFGSKGVGVFKGMVQYSEKLGISMKSLRGFMDVTDTFEGATEAFAKINSMFGTSINSLEMVLEEDPSKRFEVFRQAFISTGRTAEDISRREAKLAAQTFGITEEDFRAAMKNNESLADIEKRRIKEEKKKAQNEREYQRALSMTATTLFSFQQAWEGITRAINRAIDPLTSMLGLSESGAKKGKTFGDVMSRAFGTLRDIIDRIAKNESFREFMRRVARDAGEFIDRVKSFVSGTELTSWIDRAAKGMANIYRIAKVAFDFIVDHGDKVALVFAGIADNLGKIIALFGTIKALKGVSSLIGLGGAVVGGGSGGLGLGGLLSGALKGVGKASIGGIAGGLGATAIEKAVGLESTAAGGAGGLAGSIVGGVIGSFAGPGFGTAVGSALGAAAGKVLGDFFSRKTKDERKLDDANRDLERTTGDLSKLQKDHADKINLIEKRRALRELELGDSTSEVNGKFAILSSKIDDAIRAESKKIDLESRVLETKKNIADVERKSKIEKARALLGKEYAGVEKGGELMSGELGAGWSQWKESHERWGANVESERKKFLRKYIIDLETQALESEKAYVESRASVEKKKQVLDLEGMLKESPEFKKFSDERGPVDESTLSSFIEQLPEGKDVGGLSWDDVMSVRARLKATVTPERTTTSADGVSSVSFDEDDSTSIVGRRRTTGGTPAKNYAKQAGRDRASRPGSTTLVAGDVYLDGRLVGRHIAKELLSTGAH